MSIHHPSDTATHALHLWLDRSGSIDPRDVARVALGIIEEAEARHIATGVATRIQVSTFTHVMGSTKSLPTTCGELLTETRHKSLREAIRELDENLYGGTDLQPIYDLCLRPEETEVDHVLITDLIAGVPTIQTHPDNIRFMVLPDLYRDEHIRLFLENVTRVTGQPADSIQVGLSS